MPIATPEVYAECDALRGDTPVPDPQPNPELMIALRTGAPLHPQRLVEQAEAVEMTPEQRVVWEAEVHSLYHDGMVRIVVTPTWAKLIDFETTLPSAVEELIRQREERQRG